MPSYTLTDAKSSTYVETFSLTSKDLNLGSGSAWSIEKVRLKGGRRDGVDMIQVDNGSLSFRVLPTRGMNLWNAHASEIRLGWDSPVRDGPVNPAFVDAQAWGGLGWLDGFDELVARCGLDSFGPPYQDGDRNYTLHGRVSNIPAHHVSIHVDDHAPHAITIEGRVIESRLFHTQIEMVTRITTVPGSRTITVRDEFTNLRETPSNLQILYHCNFGPPLMEEGAKFIAPCKTIVPRDEAAIAGLDHYETYGPPTPGSAEAVYFFELIGDGDESKTLTVLRNKEGNKGVAMRFSTRELPAFTLWKNQGGRNEGYVTGLEPGSGYPNPKPFEAARGRVKSLGAGETVAAEIVFEVSDSAKTIEAWEAEIKALQATREPTIYQRPVEPFSLEA